MNPYKISNIWIDLNQIQWIADYPTFDSHGVLWVIGTLQLAFQDKPTDIMWRLSWKEKTFPKDDPEVQKAFAEWAELIATWKKILVKRT